jgi:hypothetical protein
MPFPDRISMFKREEMLDRPFLASFYIKQSHKDSLDRIALENLLNFGRITVKWAAI